MMHKDDNFYFSQLYFAAQNTQSELLWNQQHLEKAYYFNEEHE